ncbi:hypothetical protein JCM5353_006196 [Sporobolomyces roseus]
MQSTISTLTTQSTPPAPPPPGRLTLEPLSSPTSGFLFPSIYSFPPFFTKQPNPQTWSHQLSQWIQLILAYCKYTKTSEFNAISNQLVNDSELFNNKAIKRQLPLEVLSEILISMSNSNPPTIEFHSPISSRSTTSSSKPVIIKGGCYIYWKTPQEWSKTIYDWIKETGQQGSILTFYELTQDPNVSSLEFYKLPEGLLRKVLEILRKEGKCTVLRGTLGEEGDGVKFV